MSHSEYGLLVAVVLPFLVIVGMQAFLFAAGERGTLLFPSLRPYESIALAEEEEYEPSGVPASTAAGRLYRDFTFEGRSDDIIRSDSAKAGEIVHHLKQNPSQQVAIDGPNKRYVQSVYDALVDAGVPKSKIQTGTFGTKA